MAESQRSVNDQELAASANVITHITGAHNSVQAVSPGASMVVTTIADNHRRQYSILLGRSSRHSRGCL
jgi:hypothetical protein